MKTNSAWAKWAVRILLVAAWFGMGPMAWAVYVTVDGITYYEGVVCSCASNVTVAHIRSQVSSGRSTNTVKSIGNHAFKNCTNLTSVTIPDSVTSIGWDAFFGCSGMKNLTIGNGVTNIGRSAFSGCSSLTSVTIPESVTGSLYAFSNCSNLVSATIGNGVTDLGCFDGCTSLKNVTIGNGVTNIGFCAFQGCSRLANVVIPDGVTNIEDFGFKNCSGLTSVMIGNSVTNIGFSAFSGCSGLTNITISDSVTNIGNIAFSSCSSLTSVTIPDSVTNIGSGAFSYCSGLTSVTIGNGVRSIQNGEFENCEKLMSVTFGDSVTIIGSYAFQYCKELTNVFFKGEVPSVAGDAFREIGSRSRWGYYTAAHAAEWKAVINPDGKWRGFIMAEYEEPPDCEVWFHGNGAWRSSDGSTTVKQAFTYGEAQALLRNPFNRTGLFADDISGRFRGWSVGKAAFDWKPDGEGSLEKDGAVLTLGEENLLAWAQSGGATVEDGIPVLHLYAVWESEMQVDFFNVRQGNPLEPADLANHVFFLIEADGTWRKSGAKTAFLPGTHKLALRVENGYEDFVRDWDVVDAAGRVLAKTDGYYVFRIDATKGPYEFGIAIRLKAKEPDTGWLTFNCTSQMTAAQKAACPAFPPFDEGKVQITLRTSAGNAGAGIALAPGERTTLPAGTYWAEFGYQEQAGTSGMPYWCVTSLYRSVTRKITITAAKERTEPVVFRPFGSVDTDYHRIAFDGNGGSVTGGPMWFGHWYGNAQGELDGYALPTASRTGRTFAGWHTPEGKLVADGDWRTLERLMRLNPRNLTLKAHWTQDDPADGWNYTVSGDTATVTGATRTTGDLVVPASLGGCPVTGIQSSAFRNCSGATSVAIPASVTNVGANAFAGADGLATLYVPAAWEGTDMLSGAGVPAGCTVAYGIRVAFDAAGGTCATASRTYDIGDVFGELPEASKANATFDGWWTGEGGTGTQATADSPVETGTTALHAKWIVEVFTVQFDANGGTGTVQAQEIVRNTTTPLRPNAFTRTGYAFAGWSKTATGEVVYADKASVKNLAGTGGRVTLYAQWTANTYAVTLDRQSGTGGTASTTATYGSAMPTVTVPTRTGYTFGGYWTAANGGGTQYYTASGTSARTWDKTAATTLHAKWIANTYTVALDRQGGTGGTASVTATYGSALPAITLPQRAGFTFQGYFAEAGGKGTQYYAFDGKSAANWNKAAAATLYAHWTETVLHVDAVSGNDANDGLSWATAKASIQAAINAAEDGVRILVGDGVYGPIDTVNSLGNAGGKQLEIISANGAEKTVIDASSSGANRATFLGRSDNYTGKAEGPQSVLEGFTIRGARQSPDMPVVGAGVCGGILRRCIVTDNQTQAAGGGVAYAVCESCTISGNKSTRRFAGGAYFCTLTDCIIEGNEAAENGGGTVGGRLVRCIVRNNKAAQYGGGFTGGDAEDCLFAGNEAKLGGGAVAGANLSRCTVVSNRTEGTGGGAIGSVLHGSIVWGNTAGEADDNCNTSNGNYTDTLPALPGRGNISANPLFLDAASGDYRLSPGSPCIDTGFGPTGTGRKDLSGGQRWQGVRMDMGAYEAASSSPAPAFAVVDLWVDAANGNDANAGTARDKALASIGAAAEKAADGATIHVLPGTYAPFSLDGRTLTVQATGGAEKTIVSGGGTARCAWLGTDSASVLAGLTLCDGYVPMDGGGVWGGTLRDCIIRDNTAGERGGGAVLARLERCRVHGNSAVTGSGGGTFACDLSDCLVYRNSAVSGGGIRSEGHVVVNCTVAENSATRQGGGIMSAGYVTNCIVWGNSAPDSPDLWGCDEWHNCTPVPEPGRGGVAADPLFVDAASGDFRLRTGSPCIDTGADDCVQGDADLDGNVRIFGGAVDIGAYEHGSGLRVRLDPQGGSGGTDSVIAVRGKPMPEIAKPTRAGYAFGGYFTGTDGTGTQYYTPSGASARNWNGTSATTLHAKWTSTALPVYRFYSQTSKGHFFTISEAEKNNLIANNSNWRYERVAYRAFTNQVAGTVPLYRFYSQKYKGHFYTISESEKNNLIATSSNWKYERIAYYVHPSQAAETVPVYRFWSQTYGHHFYTTSEAEKDNLIATNPNWKYETVAFWALSPESGAGTGWTMGSPVPVPHSWLKEKAAEILAANGGDCETAAKAKAANGVNTVWECYVAGLDPTDAEAAFKAEVAFVDGKPVVTSDPDLGDERMYTVEGAENLGGAWGPTNAATRFFRVKVSLPE